eukprot:4284506-Prymnesium_polylepis.1
MGMERAWERGARVSPQSVSREQRCCSAGQRFRWAGAAVAAAGFGVAGGADLFASALRMLAAI